VRPALIWAKRLGLELGTLLASLLKWTLLAAAAGVLAGASTAVFLQILAAAIAAAQSVAAVWWLLLPLGFAVGAVIVRVLAPEAEGHGTDRVIEAVHRRWGRIPFVVAPVKLAATVITIAAGGSVGKEGPAAQIGAALASALGRVLFLRRRDHRKLVVCGIGAGFAAVFGTPIAGSIFGVEVLVMGTLMYDVLYPSFIAGIVSYFVARALGTTYFHEAISTLPSVTQGLILKLLLAGIVFGLVALLLIEAMKLAAAVARRAPGPRWMIAGAGGVVIAGLAAATSTRYLGLGLDTLEDALRGVAVPLEASLMKIAFTAISLGVGGSGGIITPVFFIGATAGSAVGAMFGMDRAMFAAIGMVSLLAAAANAPIASAIMALELFGPAVGPYAALSAVVSFLIVGHRSVYGSQLLGFVKSGTLVAPSGVELERLTGLVKRNRTSRSRALLRAVRAHRRTRSAGAPRAS
jgi:H+/Cl- antiporter ClcA